MIERRLAASDAVLGNAPVLIVPWLTFDGAHTYADGERAAAERMFLLSGGAAIQNLLLGASAQGLASCWISSSIFCREEAKPRSAWTDRWHALGTVACGPMPEGGPAGPVRRSTWETSRPGRDASHGPALGTLCLRGATPMRLVRRVPHRVQASQHRPQADQGRT